MLPQKESDDDDKKPIAHADRVGGFGDASMSAAGGVWAVTSKKQGVPGPPKTPRLAGAPPSPFPTHPIRGGLGSIPAGKGRRL